MATPGATIAERISDLIGSQYATIPSLSYKDLIHAAFNEVADMYKTSKVYTPQRPGEADKTLASFSKATEILKYNPKRSLKDYINKFINGNRLQYT